MIIKSIKSVFSVIFRTSLGLERVATLGHNEAIALAEHSEARLVENMALASAKKKQAIQKYKVTKSDMERLRAIQNGENIEDLFPEEK